MLLLGFFSSILKESRTQDKADVYARMGLCYKNSDYNIASLLKGCKKQLLKADILAQWRLLCALWEEIPAKALFREAFLLSLNKDLELLESEPLQTA